jgi:DNA-binding transcriptional MerR regulator
MSTRAHGSLLAADVGELVGVSGTTIGQGARHGYIRSSQREAEPRLYAVEDVAEAAIVQALLARGVRRPEVRRAVARLRAAGGPWPLSEALLATLREQGRTRLLLREGDVWLELTARGWQRTVAFGDLDEVRLRLTPPRRPSSARGRATPSAPPA